MKRIKSIHIKKYLEQESGIPDIGEKNKERFIADLKKAYCVLARTYTSETVDEIGRVLRIGYGHDSVLYAIKKFNELYPVGDLECEEIYNKAYKHFASIYGYVEIEGSIEQQRQRYEQKVSNLISKFLREIEMRDKIIEEQKKKISKLDYKLSIVYKIVLKK